MINPNEPNKTLHDKVALVTGASRGIGRATALALARAGATVILTARDQQLLQELAEQITRQGNMAQPIVTDLAGEQDIKRLANKITGQFGRLDILVNNAGITLSRRLEDTTSLEFDRLMAVNVRSAFILCRETVALLRQARPGHIINISSVVGVKGYPLQTAYTASKHALRGFSIALAEELKPDDVRVHVICPGGVDTQMVSRVRPDINKDELIQPEEIAELIVYLVSHQGQGVVDEIRIRRATSSPWF